MFRKIAALGLAASLVALTSCHAGAGAGELEGVFNTTSAYYLKTNLHADSTRRQLYSTNYLQATLLPIGSEVTIDRVSGKNIQFTMVATAQTFTYTRDKHLVESFASNLERYFGTTDESGSVSSMSAEDQAGIKAGKAMVGMTRDGVTLAIGYPPDHATPSLETPAWKYWKNRWVSCLVTFNDDGIVTSVEG